MDERSFDNLVEEAEKAHFEGWDFSFIKDRWSMEVLSWDYRTYVLGLVAQASALLDVGTGGGEFLASLAPLPARAFATEGYPPNVELARKRLQPLGVQVVDTSDGSTRLPFPDAAFDLITDRHSGAAAEELWRCLSQSGNYITEQVGDQDSAALNQWFSDGSRDTCPGFNLNVLVEQLTQAGLRVVHAQEAYPECVYKDIGAVVYHLEAIPWMVPGFDVAEYRARLLNLHEHIKQHGGFRVRRHRFFVHARKDAS